MKAVVETGRQIHDLAEHEPIVVFEDVSIGFDGKKVLDHVSFEVDRGQTLIILGPAGCGKSVLMKLANGLMLPDSGSIKVVAAWSRYTCLLGAGRPPGTGSDPVASTFAMVRPA